MANLVTRSLEGLYQWTMGLAAHRYAIGALALVAFIESSVFPIPPDVMLIPMILAARNRAWMLAAVCTAASVAGGLAGYGIGVFAFETVGQWVLDTYHLADKFEAVKALYQEHGVLVVFTAGLTPLPYKVFTITSGLMNLDLLSFTGASIVGRGMRFFLVAGLLYAFGPAIRRFVETYLPWVALAFLVLLIGGFVAIAYLL